MAVSQRMFTPARTALTGGLVLGLTLGLVVVLAAYATCCAAGGLISGTLSGMRFSTLQRNRLGHGGRAPACSFSRNAALLTPRYKLSPCVVSPTTPGLFYCLTIYARASLFISR